MNDKPGKILFVDDDQYVLHAGALFLKRHNLSVRTESNAALIPALMKEEHFDVILLDMNYSPDVNNGQEGFFWLERILELDPLAVVILITAFGDVELAVRALKAGATDFILKPWHNGKLLATLSAALAIRRSRDEVGLLKSRQQQLGADLDQHFRRFIGNSPQLQQIFATIQKVAKTDANVLILGENGTGKELIARELHRQSLRSENVFITVDMGMLSAGLFESELFGHTKGSFTDAREDRAGRFETASGGTLFLDEIGNLPLVLQSKLLTALQNREITRIGSNKPIRTDIRIVAATNMPIHEMVKEKRFRLDLLYRINTVEIQLPPLRERIDDIPLLVNHFISQFSKHYHKPNLVVPHSTLKKLEQYHWPGNIRELEHVVERAIIMTDDDVLRPDIFFLADSDGLKEPSPEDVFKLNDVEKSVIQKVLIKHKNNITRAAKELGLTRTSLYRRIEKYGL